MGGMLKYILTHHSEYPFYQFYLFLILNIIIKVLLISSYFFMENDTLGFLILSTAKLKEFIKKFFDYLYNIKLHFSSRISENKLVVINIFISFMNEKKFHLKNSYIYTQ